VSSNLIPRTNAFRTKSGGHFSLVAVKEKLSRADKLKCPIPRSGMKALGKSPCRRSPKAISSRALRKPVSSSDSKPITVNLQGNLPTQTEFGPLAYQQISSFKSYSVISNVGGVYNFEIRDQASDSLLLTYGWNYPYFKNNTIVISGSEAISSSTPLQVFQVNNY
jgi:hypothetical protein